MVIPVFLVHRYAENVSLMLSKRRDFQDETRTVCTAAIVLLEVVGITIVKRR